jgi:hypothetical protein
MPTCFGRGLELLPAKYPLKWTLEKRTKYPFYIQEGPHSYLYDDNQSISLVKLSLLNTSIGSQCFSSWIADKHSIRLRFVEPSLHEKISFICNSGRYDILTSTMCHTLFVSLILDKSLDY